MFCSIAFRFFPLYTDLFQSLKMSDDDPTSEPIEDSTFNETTEMMGNLLYICGGVATAVVLVIVVLVACVLYRTGEKSLKNRSQKAEKSSASSKRKLNTSTGSDQTNKTDSTSKVKTDDSKKKKGNESEKEAGSAPSEEEKTPENQGITIIGRVPNVSKK